MSKIINNSFLKRENYKILNVLGSAKLRGVCRSGLLWQTFIYNEMKTCWPGPCLVWVSEKNIDLHSIEQFYNYKILMAILNVLHNGDTPQKLYRCGHIYRKHSTILNWSLTPVLLNNRLWETLCTLCLTTTPHPYRNLACNLAPPPFQHHLSLHPHCSPPPSPLWPPHSLHWKHWSKKRPPVVQ